MDVSVGNVVQDRYTIATRWIHAR